MYENHKTPGEGFREVVYNDAMEFEFKNTDIPHEREKQFHIPLGELLRMAVLSG